MRVVMFYHSLVSDWNHGNAHFLRGVAAELQARGHRVEVLEPKDSWSRTNLEAEHGPEPLARFHQVYPGLRSVAYDRHTLDLEQALDGADLVLVHEWNEPDLVRDIGRHRARAGRYRLFFHDTHHRMITQPRSMQQYDLEAYDGVLAYGEVLRRLYEREGLAARAWTWHEAADTRVFRPWTEERTEGDLVWIGNWGDGERTRELDEFLIRPCRALGLRSRVYGVRYPDSAVASLRAAGLAYAGWLPNFDVPRVFARFKVTVHIPRRPYVAALPGIPTIRPFEALACGIPLVCSPWDDKEHLFTPGADFLTARDEPEMTRHLRALLADAPLRRELSQHGLRTIRSRHTCAHRVDELLAIAGLDRPQPPARPARREASPAPATLAPEVQL